MMNESISSIMTTNLITASPRDTLSEVENILKDNRIHHVPIVDDNGHLVGLLTTYDIFKLAKHHGNFNRMLARDVMTTKLATLEPEDKVGSAAECFLENLFHAIPIVKNEKLLGLVTSFDVLKYSFAKEYPRHVFV